MPGLRVLFLGGTGIIGSACARLAVVRGIELSVLNRGQTTGRPLPPGAREIVAWHDEDPARQRIAAGVDAVTGKLAQAFQPGT